MALSPHPPAGRRSLPWLALAPLLLLGGCAVPPLVSVVGGAAVEIAGDMRDLPTQVRDKGIAWESQAALSRDPQLDQPLMKSYCFQGHLFVVGWRKGAGDDQRVREVGEGVEGVREITTWLHDWTAESAQGVAGDLAITAQVRALLLQAPKVSSKNFEVTTYQGRVALLGVAGSREELAEVLELAGQAHGVREVKSLLLLPGRTALPEPESGVGTGGPPSGDAAAPVTPPEGGDEGQPPRETDPPVSR